jgi:hypothetical protein
MHLIIIVQWRKRVVHVHFSYKHGSNPQITIDTNLKSTKSPFSNVDLVWILGVRHRGANKASIEIAYIPHARVWVPGRWVKWCKNLGGMEHIQEVGLVKGYKKPINKNLSSPYLVWHDILVLFFWHVLLKHIWWLLFICFIGTNVFIIPMIITMTQTMQDQPRKDVWPPFQLNNCTHNLRWRNYVFTIEHTLKRIKNWHMGMIEIPNHRLACHGMLFKILKLWNITLWLNWVWATRPNKCTTNTKPYGGNMWMQVKV